MSGRVAGEALPPVWVRGIGLLGPGFDGWPHGRAVLKAPERWVTAPTVLPALARLPPAERRRAGVIVKLSLVVADEACRQAGADAGDLATVFSASTGDAANCHALCEALAQRERLVSPTRFTNSVHNASAGYWHITAASRAPSTSLCAHDASFAAGLLEALSQCLAGQRPVLLVAADMPYPEPLRSVRPIPDAMGIALLLDPRPADGAVARLSVRLGAGPEPSPGHPRFAALRAAIPAARGLPLLEAFARDEPAECSLALQPGLALQVGVQPAGGQR